MNTFYKNPYPHNGMYTCRCDRCHSSFDMADDATYKYCPYCGVAFQSERKARPKGYPRGAWDRGISMKYEEVTNLVPYVCITYDYNNFDDNDPWHTDTYCRQIGAGPLDYENVKVFLQDAENRNARENCGIYLKTWKVSRHRWLPVKKDN